MIKIFDDGILEATLYQTGWTFMRWANNQHGRLQKKLIQDLNYMERWILETKRPGWFTDSELGHSDFHKLLIKFGAMPREVAGEYQRFVKPLLKESDLHKGVTRVRICA